MNSPKQPRVPSGRPISEQEREWRKKIMGPVDGEQEEFTHLHGFTDPNQDNSYYPGEAEDVLNKWPTLDFENVKSIFQEMPDIVADVDWNLLRKSYYQQSEPLMREAVGVNGEKVFEYIKNIIKAHTSKYRLPGEEGLDNL